MYTLRSDGNESEKKRMKCEIVHETKFNERWKAMSEVYLKSPDAHSIELE